VGKLCKTNNEVHNDVRRKSTTEQWMVH